MKAPSFGINSAGRHLLHIEQIRIDGRDRLSNDWMRNYESTRGEQVEDANVSVGSY